MVKAVLKKIAFSCPRALAALCLGLFFLAFAQQSVAQPAQQAAQTAGIPDEYRLNLLIRSSIIALNQANMTGNYSVLRELGTPSFQMTNNPARLAEIFASLRARKLDLSPIMFFNPKLVSQPAIQDNQILRLTGFFPTAPEQVNFDLAFQLFANQWMLAGIAVSTSPANEAQRNAQTSSLQAPPPSNAPHGSNEGTSAGGDGKIRIDLSESPPHPSKKPPAKKPKPAPAHNAQPPAQQQQEQAPPKPAASNDKEQDAAHAKSSSVKQEWAPASE